MEVPAVRRAGRSVLRYLSIRRHSGGLQSLHNRGISEWTCFFSRVGFLHRHVSEAPLGDPCIFPTPQGEPRLTFVLHVGRLVMTANCFDEIGSEYLISGMLS